MQGKQQKGREMKLQQKTAMQARLSAQEKQCTFD